MWFDTLSRRFPANQRSGLTLAVPPLLLNRTPEGKVVLMKIRYLGRLYLFLYPRFLYLHSLHVNESLSNCNGCISKLSLSNMSNLSREAAREIIDSIKEDNGGISPADREATPPGVLRSLANVRRKLGAATKTYTTH